MVVKAVTFEGLPGCGKSTLLELVRKQWPELLIVNEPVDEWTRVVNVKGQSKLAALYQGEGVCEFQLLAQMQRIAAVKEALDAGNASVDKTIVMERWIDSGNAVFGCELVERGQLTKQENDVVERLCNLLKPPLCQLVVLIKTPPKECIARIHKRNRAGEDISLDLMERLDDYYNKWISDPNAPPVVELDGTCSPQELLAQFSVILNKI